MADNICAMDAIYKASILTIVGAAGIALMLDYLGSVRTRDQLHRLLKRLLA
jgi:hypothetical protein